MLMGKPPGFSPAFCNGMLPEPPVPAGAVLPCDANFIVVGELKSAPFDAEAVWLFAFPAAGRASVGTLPWPVPDGTLSP